MKKAIIFTTFLLFFTQLESQVINEVFLQSTVLIYYKKPNNILSIGTGFLVVRKIDQNKDGHFLITCKHVLPKKNIANSIWIRVNTRIGNGFKISELEIPIFGKDWSYLPSVLLHPKKGFDVAAVYITEEVKKYNIQGTWFAYSAFGTKEKLLSENITIGDEIFVLGYPAYIFDSRNVSPVSRQGIIATLPTEGYAFNDAMRQKFNLPSRIDGFLIDANIFPGSSGSLVIFKPQPALGDPSGQSIIRVSRNKKTPYLLGIVSKSIIFPDKDLKSSQRIGLGVVYSSDTIKETIEQFYK